MCKKCINDQVPPEKFDFLILFRVKANSKIFCKIEKDIMNKLLNNNILKYGLILLMALNYDLALAQDDSDADKLEPVIVLGRAQQYYRADSSTIGSKTETELMNLPASAQVITEQLMKDQAARNITDLYRSVPGVSEFSYSGITFRGFREDGNVFYDGVRGDPYSGFSVPQLFNVERVEILKGPMSALYGAGEPAGLINYVTKKPSFDKSINTGVSFGNYNLIGGYVDSRGAITDKVAHRIAVFKETQDSFRKNADSDNLEIAGGLLFQLSDSSSLDFNFDIVEQHLGGNRLRGVPVDDRGNFLVSRTYNSNESSDFQNLDALILQSSLQHSFSDQLRSRTTVRYLENEREQEYHESRSWVDVNGDGVANILDETIKREFRDQFRGNDEISITTDLIYDFELGNIENTFLVGADYHEIDTEYDYLRARYEADGVGNLNIFNLNYGETNSKKYNLSNRNAAGVKVERYSLYLQDQIKFNENLYLLGGVRWDNFEDARKSDGFDYSDSNLTPRAGLVYKPFENTALYLNYSESFKPLSTSVQDDVDYSYDPEYGNQIEIGIKQNLFNDRILATLAFYQIEKDNVIHGNPDDTGYGDGIPDFVQYGGVESKGIEFLLEGDLTENWTVTGGYAYNDCTVSEAGDFWQNFSVRNKARGVEGARFVNAPEHQLGLWTRYNVEQLNSAFAFGVNYVSEQISFEGQRVKPFTVYDASWTLSNFWGAAEFQLNVKNLFDKEYAISGFNKRGGHFPGEPRSVVGQLRYTF